MKVTILCENSVTQTVPRGLIGEHGLSYLIEEKHKTLYDTGQSSALLHNARLLGKDLRSVDRIILSHGHYDHTGGLKDVLSIIDNDIPVHVHPDAFKNRIAFIPLPDNNIEIPIGMPCTKKEYEDLGARFEDTRGFERLNDSIAMISEIKRPDSWVGSDMRLKVKENDVIIDDPFTDDLSLVLETGSGPVVLLGCAHAGIVEILDDISKNTGHSSFHAVIGGTHLGPASPGYVSNAVDAIKKYSVKILAPMHCTGFKRMAELLSAFPEQFQIASSGTAFEF